jgi:hypothetical protein
MRTLPLLVLLLVLPSSRAASAAPSCGAPERLQLEAVFATGGTLDFDCTGSIEIDETLVANGVDVTLIGPSVSIVRDTLGPAIRLLDVRGSTLTLDGISLREGFALGANGVNGADGEDGVGGSHGSDGGEGQNGQIGQPGGNATEAEDGTDGGEASGGAMLIDAASTVVLQNCFVSQNDAAGGLGGDGGQGGRGGDGGTGGRGGPGPGKNAGNGADGGIGGAATPGRDGGSGGLAFGGAIANAGSLTIDNCTFQSNGASGGSAGRGRFGGVGGGGGGGGRGGDSTNTEPMFPNDNQGLGGNSGNAGNGVKGENGGNGGNGGSGFGGAIFNTGTLSVSNSRFQFNFAAGRPSGFGASAGNGGNGGDGNFGGRGKPGGKGGNGGDAAAGGIGGSNGTGGGSVGGAIFSTTPIKLIDVTFSQNSVAGGSGGSDTCTPGSFNCFGAAGPGGLRGDKGFGGANDPIGSGHAPDGTDGIEGEAGTDGAAGAPGFGVEANCQANNATCTVPEPEALSLGLVAIGACAALRRRVVACGDGGRHASLGPLERGGKR